MCVAFLTRSASRPTLYLLRHHQSNLGWQPQMAPLIQANYLRTFRSKQTGRRKGNMKRTCTHAGNCKSCKVTYSCSTRKLSRSEVGTAVPVLAVGRHVWSAWREEMKEVWMDNLAKLVYSHCTQGRILFLFLEDEFDCYHPPNRCGVSRCRFF